MYCGSVSGVFVIKVRLYSSSKMLKITNLLLRNSNLLKQVSSHARHFINSRTFLSQSYYCSEVWQDRLKNPLLQNINLDEFYNDLDIKYNSTKTISAVDVDIFVNIANNEIFADELLDLVHKLRLGADTCNTFNSTHHAVVRYLINFGKKDELLNILDDRLNYGIFLDHYTSCLLLDTFWKSKDYTSGARIAIQMMLQEDFDHPLCATYSLLHCYNYLLNPTGWPEPPKPEETEEEVKIRVNYLRNPYDDNHFDLRDPQKLVGKAMAMITKQKNNMLEKSLRLVGLALFEEHEEAKLLIDELIKSNDKVLEDALKLIPEQNETKVHTQNLLTEKGDIQKLLQDAVKLAEQAHAEKDIAQQCENVAKWDQERLDALERQKWRLSAAKRLENVEITKQTLEEKEMLLWYFENKDKYDLEIEEKQAIHSAIKKEKINEEYVPPEIRPQVAQ